MLQILQIKEQAFPSDRHILELQWMIVVAAVYLLQFSEKQQFAFANLVLTALLLIATGLVTILLGRVGFRRWISIVLATLDTAAIIAVIYFTGFASTDFYLVFILVLILAAIIRNLRFLAIATFLIACFYGWLMWSTDPAGFLVSPELLIRIPFIFVVALFFGLLLFQQRQQEHRAQRTLEFTQDLFNFGRDLTRSLDEEQIVAKCPRTVKEIMHSDAVELLLMEGDSVRSGAFCADRSAASDANQPNSPQPMSSAAPVASPELSFQSRMVTRLRSENQDFGELRIFRKGAHRWTDEEKVKFEFLGTQVAIALQMAQLFKKIESQAKTDSLTQIANRRHFYERLEEELERSRRKQRQCTVVLMDLDHFKDINDHYGHSGGDKVLIYVAQVFKKGSRISDVVARYGGDEFALILPETDATKAQRLVERIMQELERNPSAFGVIGLSVGIASYPDHAKDVKELEENVDKALYQAKKAGRNKIVIFSG
ncbi:MAG: diguanylate cyclase [Acidobacteria bacterium]|nr:diguanylate cyclase [Acidobacteriota bacterium]